MSDEKMLPCPFCGRTDLLGVERHPVKGFLCVWCRACGAIGPSGRSLDSDPYGDREAIAHWNRCAESLEQAARREMRRDGVDALSPQVDANAAPLAVPRDAHPLLHSLAHDIENLDGEIARLTATRARIEADLRGRLRESGTAVSATIGAPDVKPAALSPRLSAVEAERIRLCIDVAEIEGVIEEGEQSSLKVAIDRVVRP